MRELKGKEREGERSGAFIQNHKIILYNYRFFKTHTHALYFTLFALYCITEKNHALLIWKLLTGFIFALFLSGETGFTQPWFYLQKKSLRSVYSIEIILSVEMKFAPQSCTYQRHITGMRGLVITWSQGIYWKTWNIQELSATVNWKLQLMCTVDWAVSCFGGSKEAFDRKKMLSNCRFLPKVFDWYTTESMLNSA